VPDTDGGSVAPNHRASRGHNCTSATGSRSTPTRSPTSAAQRTACPPSRRPSYPPRSQQRPRLRAARSSSRRGSWPCSRASSRAGHGGGSIASKQASRPDRSTGQRAAAPTLGSPPAPSMRPRRASLAQRPRSAHPSRIASASAVGTYAEFDA
jgi:hypothetical protein